MVLRIQRAEDGNWAVFNLSGRMDAEHVAEIQRLFEFDANNQILVLDLKEVTLVDRHAVSFLSRREEHGTMLRNCPSHIREWIVSERNGM
jgi:anti-anti-sigma regulatory factor